MAANSDENIDIEDLIICPRCDTIHKKTVLGHNRVAHCSECGRILYSGEEDFVKRGIALSVTGLILFVVAVSFPLVRISTLGHENYVSIVSMIEDLYGSGYIVVASIVTFVIVLFPAAIHMTFMVVGVLMSKRLAATVCRRLLSILSIMAPWNMADIFLVSILVSVVKLTGYAQIQFGAAFWALVFFVLTDLMLGMSVKINEMWENYGYVYGENYTKDNISGADTTRERRFVRCKICDAVNIDAGGDTVCYRCGIRVYGDISSSIARAWAFLLTAVILYFPANIYPILVSHDLGGVTENTIIGGIILLYNEGSWFIAGIILVASVFVPILKFLLLSYLLVNIHRPLGSSSRSQQHRLYYISEIIGPWSMVDIFVVAILAGLVHVGGFEITAGPGARAFVLMVLFTLLSAYSIDTRFFRERGDR